MKSEIIVPIVDLDWSIKNMNKNIYWSIAIKNSICMICWTALAVVFNKWWIALFAALFITSYATENVHKYYRKCDNCGKHGPYADNPDDALKKAKLAGWIHFDQSNMDYCPDCKTTGGT